MAYTRYGSRLVLSHNLYLESQFLTYIFFVFCIGSESTERENSETCQFMASHFISFANSFNIKYLSVMFSGTSSFNIIN